jgi:hypothetical protein
MSTWQRAVRHRLFVLLAVASGGTALAAQEPACGNDHWSPPVALEPTVSMLEAMRYPTIASNGPETYVAGSVGFDVPIARFRHLRLGRYQWPPRLSLARPGMGRVTTLSGAHWFAYPDVAIDGQGTVHVVWGDADEAPPPTPPALPPTLTTIWYARYFHGAWSAPRGSATR